MPMIRAMRLLNAVEAGTTSGVQLQTLLNADAGRLAEWNVLMGMRGQTRRMAASSTAMTAVAASSTAMTAVAASSTAMTAVIASSTAMTAVNANDQAVRIWMLAGTNQVWSNFASVTAVAASSTAMAAVAASSTAKMAVFNSDTALNAIAASATAMAAMRAASGYIVGTNTASTSPVAISGPNAAGSYIMLGYSKNNAISQGISLFSTRRSGSAIATSAAAITSAASTAGADVNIALPLVAPFQSTATTATGLVWYFGMLRCDV